MASPLHGSVLRPLSIAVCVVAALAVTLPNLAQRTTPQTRIIAVVDNSRRSTLVGSLSPRAIAANDVGAVDPNMQLQGITLVLSPTSAQKTALDALAASQQNPSSPQYHHWLTPEQFAAQFGMADADIATVSFWLEREGFVVGSVSRGRNRITFSGNAGQVAAAFGAPLHFYKTQAESTPRYAPSGSLSIPAALSSVVQSVQNISSFRPHPQMVPAPTQPMFTVGGNQLAFLTPPDVAMVYDVNPVTGSGYNGNGQTIAVVGQSAIVAQDLVNFQTALGVAVKPQTLNLIPGTGTSAIVSGDEAESDLDLEYSSAMAPGATVAFYYVGNSGSYSVMDAIEYVIDNNKAAVISVSYAFCEPDGGSAYIASIDAFLEQAAVQGQTVVAAAGDYGSLSCMQDGWDSTAVRQTPAVDYPASSPWVVAMGGTSFPVADIGRNPVNSTYWGPAPNGDVVYTALSYIPEQVWNDVNAGSNSGGGGISIYEPQPLWQTGVPGIPNGNFRLVPDISLAASAMNPGYLICSSDNAYFYNVTGSCTNGFRDAANNGFNVIGGTSVAAPIFAGLVAVLNQAKGYTAGQGLINPTLYSLAANSTTYAAAFHDITLGNNACGVVVNCGTGPQNTDYFSGVGYDEASGLGSIDFANLVAAWPTSTGATAASTTTTLTASTTGITFGDSVTFTATVSNGGIGNVTFLNGGTNIGTAAVNSAGVATLSLSTLSGGADSITATYDGTTGYSTSTSTSVAVNVTPVATTTTLTASATSAVYGAPVTFTATASSRAGLPSPTYIYFYCNGTYFGSVWTNGSGVATFTTSTAPNGTLPSGVDTITASYNGSANFAVSPASTAVTVAVAASPSTTKLTATPSTGPYGTYIIKLTALVTYNGGFPCTGVVTFYSNGLLLGAGTLNSGYAMASGYTLPVGSDSITAVYGADSTCGASTSNTVVVIVTQAATFTTLTASTNNTGFGSDVTFTAIVLTSPSLNPATSGVVTFLSNGSSIGSGTVNSSGVAVINLSTLASGADSITASYAGTTGFVASASTAFLVTVAPRSTSTVLSASTTSPAFGSAVSLTATVSACGTPATSGVVSFSSNGSLIGTGTVNSGVATISLSTLPSGVGSIAASYAGTVDFAASASTAILVTVSPAPTTTVLSASSTSPAFGSSVTFTATVMANGSPATGGGVNFSSNGSFIGQGMVNTSGVATISLSALPSGPGSITASYGGAVNFAASASNAVLVMVAAATTTTTLNTSSTSPAFGASVTLSATVMASGSPAASGVVSFFSNGSLIGTGTVNSGVATISLATLPSGADSITASYGGTSGFAASASTPVLVTVASAPTTTSLTASTTSPTFGSSVSFTATVSASGSPVTSGVVALYSKASLIGTGSVNSVGEASSHNTRPRGADSLTSSFGGTVNFAASVSNSVLVTVAPTPAVTTTTVLTSSTTSPTFGSSATFTATVNANGSPATSGVVTLHNGATALATGTVNSNGVASVTLTTLPIGNNSIYASYGGTSSYAASLSNVLVVTVAPASTTTVLTASTASAVYGSIVTFTAMVENGSIPANSGVVTFLDGDTTIGTGTVNNGVATLNLTTLPAGVNQVSASFAGTSNLAASASSTVLVTVTSAHASTATTLISSSTTPAPGDSVMFTATVTSDGTPVTSGAVNFLNGGELIGTGTVYNGIALLSLTTLPTGTDSITASYGGASNFAVSVSSAVIVTVALPTGTSPPASISVPTPAPVVAGDVVTTAASLSAGGSYSGTMKLTCRLTGSPAGAQSVPTCTLNPATLTLAVNGVGTAVLAVQTTAAITKQATASGLNLWGLGGGSALAGLLMFCVPSRRRRLLSMLAVLIVVAAVGSIGCGGGGLMPPPTITPATTPGAYTFTVSGVDALNPTITASAVVSVTVE